MNYKIFIIIIIIICLFFSYLHLLPLSFHNLTNLYILDRVVSSQIIDENGYQVYQFKNWVLQTWDIYIYNDLWLNNTRLSNSRKCLTLLSIARSFDVTALDFVSQMNCNEEKDPIVQYWLAIETLDSKDYISGIFNLQRIGAGAPLASLADEEYTNNNLYKASFLYESSILLGYSKLGSYIRLIDSLIRLGKPDEAELWIEKGRANWPDNPDIMHKYCQILEENSIAIDCLRNVITQSPDSPWPHYSISRLLVKENQIKESIIEQEIVADLLPENSFMRFELGKLHYQNKDYTKAADAFREAAYMDPFSPHYWYWLGNAHSHMNEAEKASEYLCKDVVMSSELRDHAITILNQLEINCNK